MVSRRSFIRKSAGAAALLSMPTIMPANVFGANDKIRVAVLCVNGRGTNHIEGYINHSSGKTKNPDHTARREATISLIS